jgi:hypothetical protein
MSMLTGSEELNQITQKVIGCLYIKYDGIIVGEYFADLVVQNLVLVELKASGFLTKFTRHHA